MRSGRGHAVVLATIVAGWSVTLIGSVTGWRNGLGHQHILDGGQSILTGATLFLIGWQVMVTAMMLPSSWGGIRWFQGLAGVTGTPHRRTIAFLVGYLGVWTVVGMAALGGDAVVHALSHRWDWLGTHPWTIAAAALLVAGGFELSRWSMLCRLSARAGHVRGTVPASVDSAEAIRLGADHGLVRLQACWPVMLVAFAFGMTSVPWMAALTVLMTLERFPRLAPRAALTAGVAFLAAAALIPVLPGLLPGVPG